MDRGAWQAIVYEVENESDVTEWLNNNNISTWYIPGTEKALSNTQTHPHTHIPFVITCSNRNHPQGGGMTVKAFRREPQDSLKVQWLRLCISNTENTGLIPGQGTKIPYAMWPKKRGRERRDAQSLLWELSPWLCTGTPRKNLLSMEEVLNGLLLAGRSSIAARCRNVLEGKQSSEVRLQGSAWVVSNAVTVVNPVSHHWLYSLMLIKKSICGTSLVVQLLGLGAFMPWARVQSLVRELGSTLCTAWPKKKKSVCETLVCLEKVRTESLLAVENHHSPAGLWFCRQWNW